jgi:hypothetical protein
MADARTELEGWLRSLAAEIDVPPVPVLVPGVLARLSAERALRRNPPFPGLALWPRRRMLALAALALAALFALAAAARLSIGAVQIRVQPTGSPSASPAPPETPVAFGREVSLSQARAAVDFPLAVPSGPAPDRAFLFTTPFGRTGAILAWEPTAASPAILGVPWGLMVIELRGEDDVLLKTVGSFGDLHEVRVAGARGVWIPVPHELQIQIDVGTRTYSVGGNVLIWQVGQVTYRVETSLGLPEALRLAATVG